MVPGEYFTPYRSAICRFIHSALLDRPYTVYLAHRRTSIFISDTVKTLASFTNTFIPGEVFNIGGRASHDMKEVSDLILSRLGKDDRQVTYIQKEPFTTRDKNIDSRKAASTLGHAPVVTLQEGLERTIAWMRQVYVEEVDVDPIAFIGGAS